MKMFFSAGVKFTASSVWGHRRPAVFILGHTCITGRASLALRATPDPAKPVPPWRKQKNRTVLRTEQREVTGTVLILMTLRHTVHLNTLPKTHPHSPSAVVWYLCRTVSLLSSGPSCPSWSTSPHTPWSPRPPWKRRHSVSTTVRQSDVEQVKWHTSALTRVWAQHRGCCWPGRLWWRHTRTCPGDRGHS